MPFDAIANIVCTIRNNAVLIYNDTVTQVSGVGVPAPTTRRA